MYYLKEEPTCFVFKNKNEFFIKINIFLEIILYKVLFIKKVIGLEYKNFSSSCLNTKESLKLIKRFYSNIKNENQIIKLINKQSKLKKNSTIILCLGGKFKVKDWGLVNWSTLIKLIIKYKKKQKFLIIGGGKYEKKKSKPFTKRIS